ncbi:MAG TPA: phosphoribosylformylglycinamidine cyclo-ligase [Planctomycetota bacterium]|nr:phosphoribosylformylglycinamidine cyclo-ligase [Planctomycetota bacterium]
MAKSQRHGLTFRDVGVETNIGQTLVQKISSHVRKTFGPQVIPGVGGFGVHYALGGNIDLLTTHGQFNDPLLAVSTDHVGSKMAIGHLTGRHDVIGHDLVAMNVNNLAMQGARPLLFVYSISTSTLKLNVVEKLVEGMSSACQQARIAMTGGETSEIPEIFAENRYMVSGFCAGVVERNKMIDGSKISPGDVVIGLHANGLHTDGFTMARRVLLDKAQLRLDKTIPELKSTLADELMKPTKIYGPALHALGQNYKVKEIIRLVIHVGEDGILGNLRQMMPAGFVARIKIGSWVLPPIYQLIQEFARMPEHELFETFNMGIGFLVVCPEYNANAVMRTLEKSNIDCTIIGEIQRHPDGTMHSGDATFVR